MRSENGTFAILFASPMGHGTNWLKKRDVPSKTGRVATLTMGTLSGQMTVNAIKSGAFFMQFGIVISR